MIEVSYDGEFPVACMGLLTIKVDGKTLYEEDNCCHSTGNVWFGGHLLWDEGEDKKIPEKLREEVREKVQEVLSKVHVCCGGCV